MVQRISALIIFIVTLPLLGALFIASKCTSSGPFLFEQLRMGKGKKPFVMYKIRTMVVDAERLKKNYLRFNEADGPVFKIRNDPRYTPFGRFLSHTGLDELPQLINIIKGDMALVGPRPLPIDEAKKVPATYAMRFSVLPGITSLWVVQGTHRMTFERWMQLDLDYVKNKSLYTDISIIFQTVKNITIYLRACLKKMYETNTS